MNVEFKYITSIMGFSRYIPVLTNEMVNFEYQMLLERANDVSFELSIMDDEAFWEYFLKHYNLIRYIEGEEGNWMKLYHLKPSIEFQLPKELAILWGKAPLNLQLNEEHEESILISQPTSGRHKEYIVLDGDFKFNTGSAFTPIWKEYTITSKNTN